MDNGTAIEPQASDEKIAKAPDERKPLKLYSPGGGPPFIYPFNAETNHLNALDILDLIRSILSDHPQIDEVISKFFKLEEVDVHNYSTIRSLCKKFNKAVHHMLKNVNGAPAKTPMSRDLLRHVVTRCYNKAVDNEKALNKHYEAFSSQTYGETSYDRMQMILDEIQPTENDVFIDLGSGVGQLVVHVAGAARVKRAVGIEIAQLPSRFATVLENEFNRHVAWYGKSCSPFKLQQGDFLDEKWRELIMQEATIIFINNFAFQSDLETRIKMELLHELKDGTRIITTKPYVALNKSGNITDRQMSDIAAIIDIVELKQCPNPCSWTSNNVPYYMHVINRAKLENYFFNKNLSVDGGSRNSSTPSSNSRESSIGLKEGKSIRANGNGGEESGYGPTTRRRWQEYCSELDQKKSGGKSGKSETPATDSKDEDDSEGFVPRKKQRRASDKKAKEKSFRGRPRKSDSGHKNSSGSHKNSSSGGMSADAKEGIELMHQITKVVSSGGTADAAVILADMTNYGTEPIRLQADGNKSTVTPSTSFPLTGFGEDNRQSAVHVTAESSLAILRDWRSEARVDESDHSSSRYPSLNTFLGELRILYENFLDSMQTPEFVRSLSDKINSEKAKKSLEETPVKQETFELSAPPRFTDQLEWTSLVRARFAERSAELVSMHKDILAKSKDLNDTILKYNVEIARFAADLQNCETEQSGSAVDNEKLLIASTQSQFNLPVVAAQHEQQQRRELLAALAWQHYLQQQQNEQEQTRQQQHQIVAAQSSGSNAAIFPATSSIEQLMMSDLAHNYSQQQQQPPQSRPVLQSQQPLLNNNNALLLSQLTQLLANSLMQNVAATAVAGQVRPPPPSALISPMAADAATTATVLHSPLFNGMTGNGASMSCAGDVGADAIVGTSFSTAAPPQRALNIAALPSNYNSTRQLLNLLNGITSGGFAPSNNEVSRLSELVAGSDESQQGQQQPVADYNRELAEMLVANASTMPSSLVQNMGQQHLQQHQQQVGQEMSVVSTSSSAMIAGTSRDAHSTVDAVVAAVAAGGTKKTRAKPTRSFVPQVKQHQRTNAQRNSSVDAEREEEVERQIKDIVEKALLVDHVAKQSEKERRARSFERRREKCSASFSIAAPNYAGASANVSAVPSSASCSASVAKKRNSSEVYSSKFEMLSPISTNAGNSSFGESAAGSAISSPVAQNFASSAASACAQLLSTAATNSVALGDGVMPMKQPIAIMSVAPPPHSPPIGVNSAAPTIDAAAEIGSVELFATDQPLHISTTSDDYFALNSGTSDQPSFDQNRSGRIGIAPGTFLNIDPSSNNLLMADSATKSLINGEIQNANALAKSTASSTSVALSSGGKKSPLDAAVSPHTPYVPLSKRTVIENFGFSLPPLSTENSASSGAPVKPSRHVAPFIKSENEDHASR